MSLLYRLRSTKSVLLADRQLQNSRSRMLDQDHFLSCAPRPAGFLLRRVGRHQPWHRWALAPGHTLRGGGEVGGPVTRRMFLVTVHSPPIYPPPPGPSPPPPPPPPPVQHPPPAPVPKQKGSIQHSNIYIDI